MAFIHGDLAQSARDRVMREFREGEIRLLIATDVMGRGIDVSGISHIINYDIPEDCDDYVHRIGRTGRLSSTEGQGAAITFVAPDEGQQLTNVEVRINQILSAYPLTGIDTVEKKRTIKHVSELPPPIARHHVVDEDDFWSVD